MFFGCHCYARLTGSLPGVWVAVVDEFGQLVPSAVAEQLAIEASAADMRGAQMRLVGLTR